jgi:hypothetical protein
LGYKPARELQYIFEIGKKLALKSLEEKIGQLEEKYLKENAELEVYFFVNSNNLCQLFRQKTGKGM